MGRASNRVPGKGMFDQSGCAVLSSAHRPCCRDDGGKAAKPARCIKRCTPALTSEGWLPCSAIRQSHTACTATKPRTQNANNPTHAQPYLLQSVMRATPILELQAVLPVRTLPTMQCPLNCILALLQLALPHKSKAAIRKYFAAHKTELESTQEANEERGSESEAEVSHFCGHEELMATYLKSYKESSLARPVLVRIPFPA